MRTLSVLIFVFSCTALFSEAFLGVYIEPASKKEITNHHLRGGVKINNVVPGSPAFSANLKAGNIIYKVNKQQINNEGDLKKILDKSSPGNTLTLQIIDNNAHRTVSIVADNPANYNSRSAFSVLSLKRKHIGILFQDLTAGLLDYFGVDNGILITEVQKNSPAEEAGLAPGDIITKVDNNKIHNAIEFKRASQTTSADNEIELTIDRRGKEFTCKVAVVEVKNNDNLHLELNYDDNIFLLGPDNGNFQDNSYGKITAWLDSLITNADKQKLNKKIEEMEKELSRIKKKLNSSH